MNGLSRSAKQRRRAAVDAAMIFVIVLLMVQMWLLTATLESYLAGHHSVALSGMLLSGALFAGSLAIYRFLVRLDHEPASEEKPRGFGPWNIH
jgi:hypothetical protein